MQESSARPVPELPLVFSRPLAIVGGGRVRPGLLEEAGRRGFALVGADGGGDAIGAAGLVPEAIVGDLDSLSDRPGWERRTLVVHLSEQMTTDFEKALYSTRAPVTVAFGMTGRRFDHTLAALHVMARYARERAIVLVDEDDIAIGVSGRFAFPARAGERVSMHPLQPVRFKRSWGLHYALDGLTLAPGLLSGTSNIATGAEVVVEPERGEAGAWLLVLEGGRLWALVDQLAGTARG